MKHKIKKTAENERKESAGWMMLAEQSLKGIWDNPKDEKVWKRLKHVQNQEVTNHQDRSHA